MASPSKPIGTSNPLKRPLDPSPPRPDSEDIFKPSERRQLLQSPKRSRRRSGLGSYPVPTLETFGPMLVQSSPLETDEAMSLDLDTSDMTSKASAAVAANIPETTSDVETDLNHFRLEDGGDTNLESQQRFSKTPDFSKLAPEPKEKRQNSKKTKTKYYDDDDDDDDDIDDEKAIKHHDHRQLDYTKPPMTSVYQVFKKIAKVARDLHLEKACEGLNGRRLRIFTACSGTEAPLIALELIRNALDAGSDSAFQIHHVASAEIVMFKAAYIERNFGPDDIFRDVTDFIHPSNTADTIYGAKKALPKDVDILIAGSACVDYSTMNPLRKVFGQVGESFATMEGISEYARREKPTIVVLENVKTAPWDLIEQHWQDVGYTTTQVNLDSKDFGIPHTRQRGYMIGINKERATEASVDAEEVCENWKKNVSHFDMRATAPYFDWIYPTGSSKLELAKKVYENTLRAPNRQQSWESSAARHMHERTNLKLGNTRRLTKWQESGGSQPADHLMQSWIKHQRERILDTLDINDLRHLVKKNYDATKKCRTLDLSQNVDRDTDSREWGIIMCQTPRGMAYDTMRGGPITGREACILQGIPVDDLDLTHMSTAELQDLAGNAMTTTVAGAVLVSAIVAAMLNKDGHPVALLRNHSQKKIELLTKDSHYLEFASKGECKAIQLGSTLSADWEGNSGLSKSVQSSAARLVSNVDEIKAMALEAIRFCECEGYNGQKPGPFAVCMDCGHTACSTCKGNPTHNYQSLPVPESNRLHPTSFIDRIKQALPRCIPMSADTEKLDSLIGEMKPFNISKTNAKILKAISSNSSCIPGGEKENRQYQEAVRKALSGTYMFRRIKRDGSWKIEYGSDHGTLELQLIHYFALTTPGTKVEFGDIECNWTLTANCDATVRAGSQLRRLLADPVATMRPEGNILTGKWKLRNPAIRRHKFTITGSGARRVAWRSSWGIGDPAFQNLETFSNLTIDLGSPRWTLPQSISFTWHKDCGAAEGSLYRSTIKLKCNGTYRYLYFFLDPYPMGDGKEDSFVLSFDPTPRTAHSSRHILVRFEAGWRPTFKEGGDLSNPVTGEYAGRTFQTKNLPAIELHSPDASFDIATWTRDQATADACDLNTCRTAGSFFIGVRIPCPEKAYSHFKEGMHYELNLRDRHERLKEFAWALECVEIPELPNYQQVINYKDQKYWRCAPCAPRAPEHTWEWSRKRKTKTLILRPFIDDQEAANYEYQLRCRPLPASASLECYGDAAHFELRLNVSTLVHRAVAPFIRRKVVSDIYIKWQINKYDVLDSMPSFIVPTIVDNSKDSLFEGLMGQGIELPAPEDTWFKRKLWANQSKALSWMIKSEEEGRAWNECNKVDAKVAPLAWNIEVEAVVEKQVFGGVLADEVGSGKTTTVLAMIAYLDRKPLSTQLNCPKDRIGLQATLIFVPNTILSQWDNQIKDCFGRNHGKQILKVRNAGELNKLTVADFKNADIILASSKILENKQYWVSLRTLCCAPNVPFEGGRALGEWMHDTLKIAGKLIEGYNGSSGQGADSSNAENAFYNLRPQAMRSAHEFAKYRPWKQTTKKAMDDATAPNQNVLNPEERQSAYPSKVCPLSGEAALDEFHKEEFDLGDQQPVWPLFHFFHFARVIVDEFTYCDPKTILAILTLETRSRWLLSGTPPTNSLSGIDGMSQLLGTRVIADGSDGVPFSFAGNAKPPQKINEQTYAEEQLSLSDAMSQGCLRSRHQNAKEFVASFVRQNASPVTGKAKIVHIVAFKPSLVEVAVYYEAFQLLSNQSMKFKLKGKMKIDPDEIDRNKAIKMAIQESQSAEHALICCAASLRKFITGTCETILEGQQSQYAILLASFETLMQELIHFRLLIHGDPVQATDQFANYLRSIEDEGEYGDSKVTETLDKIMTKAWNTHQTLLKPFSWKHHGKDELAHQQKMEKKKKGIDLRYENKKENRGRKIPDEELQRNQDTSVLVIEKREELKLRVKNAHTDTRQAVRFVRTIRVYSAEVKVSKKQKVPCDVCGIAKDAQNYCKLRISAACGHISCNTCLTDFTRILDTDDKCRVNGCGAAFVGHQLVSLTKFAQKETQPHNQCGSRNTAICDTIDTFPKEDKVVIFVQYEALKDDLVDALKQREICYEDAFNQSKRIEIFKKGALFSKKKAKDEMVQDDEAMELDNVEDDFDEQAPKTCPYEGKTPQVLIMKLDSEDSAGWNLQVVCRVIFVAPFVTESEFKYNAIDHQAIGRALRFGQANDVHVYYFAMRGTVEVNILEMRNPGKVIVENSSGQVDMVPIEQWRASEERRKTMESDDLMNGLERTHTGDLVRLNGASLDIDEDEMLEQDQAEEDDEE